ncbi:hypothetical protein [Companilactobacillus mindensis]|uniref:hypothetical protein n=1 Tax=Companilactobacillus mindensis TaxID=167481 RepID=UPI0012EEC4CE
MTSHFLFQQNKNEETLYAPVTLLNNESPSLESKSRWAQWWLNLSQRTLLA